MQKRNDKRIENEAGKKKKELNKMGRKYKVEKKRERRKMGCLVFPLSWG